MRRSTGIVMLVAGCIVSFALGCLVVRLGLDAVDTRPYAPSSEALYLLVAACALLVWFGGSAAVVLLWRRQRRRGR